MRYVFFLSLILTVSFIGCAVRPPLEEMANAKAAIKEAEALGAKTHAPKELKSAKTSYGSAESAMDKKKYGEAKDLAIDAYNKATNAKNRSISAKATRQNAEQAINDAKDAISSAEKAGARNLAEDELNQAEELLGEAQEAYSGKDYSETIKLASLSVSLARKAARIALNAKFLNQDKSQNHKVVKGECLWWISEYERIYNDPLLWPHIYEANRDRIDDPDLIFPDQVFSIPRE